MRFPWTHYVTPEMVERLRTDAGYGRTRREAFDRYDAAQAPGWALTAACDRHHILFRREEPISDDAANRQRWVAARNALKEEISAAKRERATSPPYKPALGTL